MAQKKDPVDVQDMFQKMGEKLGWFQHGSLEQAMQTVIIHSLNLVYSINLFSFSQGSMFNEFFSNSKVYQFFCSYHPAQKRRNLQELNTKVEIKKIL